ncbi:hypothetical protein [Ruegeria sp. HKCCSP351]|uniref:dCTP deaminase domain-containing protein n=1 Tax=Ruegeria sp. HKCCSP351 TaxID=2794832 RepID=UPI001AE0EC7E|nr:hypothetical protein [Ruegeria sp. HKCCSP351]
MKLLAGGDLQKDLFFKKGEPIIKGSTFDLTIGSIFDSKGDRHVQPYMLQPREMIQVVSAEVFELPSDVTGHVTYKTSLTRKGIWALTVGIIDPGWDGPVSTTLFNFSKVEFPVAIGTPFLRVSLFQHEKVPDRLLKKAELDSKYRQDVQIAARKDFPSSFLDLDQVASSASELALKKFQKTALVLISASAALFATIQLVMAFSPPLAYGWLSNNQVEMERLRLQIEHLQQEFETSTQAEVGKLGHQIELQHQNLENSTHVKVEELRHKIEYLQQNFEAFRRDSSLSDDAVQSKKD